MSARARSGQSQLTTETARGFLRQAVGQRDKHDPGFRLGHPTLDAVSPARRRSSPPDIPPVAARHCLREPDAAAPRRRAESTVNLQDAGLTPTGDAGRIELWPTPGNAFRLTTPSPMGPIVSWPRVYADLKRVGGRGDDAADHLRDVIEQERG